MSNAKPFQGRLGFDANKNRIINVGTPTELGDAVNLEYLGDAISAHIDAQSRQFINIKDHPYNAIGDGVADDRAAILAADAAGGMLYFPPGVYKVSAPVSAKSGSIWVGAGRTKSIISSSSDAAFWAFTADIEGVTIEKLGFISTKVGGSIAFGGVFGGSTISWRDVLLRDCKFSSPNIDSNGIKIVCETSGKTVDGLVIDYCSFENIGRMGIELQSHGGVSNGLNSIKVLKNKFVNTGLSNNFGMGVSISGNGKGCDISHNIFRNTLSDCIEVAGYTSTVTLADNQMLDFTPGRISSPIAITSLSGTRTTGVTITGNTSDAATGGVLLYSCDGFICTGNSFDLTGGTGKVGIRTDNGLFSNNKVLTLAPAALEIDTGVRNRVTGNFISNEGASNFATIRCSNPAATNNLIEHNTIAKGSGGSNWDEALGSTLNIFNANRVAASLSQGFDAFITIADSNLTIQTSNIGYSIYRFGGALTATRRVSFPAVRYQNTSITNETTGGQSIQVGYATGNVVTIAPGKTAIVRGSGTDFIRVTSDA